MNLERRVLMAQSYRFGLPAVVVCPGSLTAGDPLRYHALGHDLVGMPDKPKKRRRKSEEAIKDEDWPLTDEQTLALMLDTAHRRFLADRKNPLPAFDAVARTVAYVWRKGETPAPFSVPIPLWALEVIAEGYQKYMDSAAAGDSTTFGEVLQIEGGGKGRHRKIRQHLKELRDIRIAIRIALDDEAGCKIEAAIQSAASAHDLDYRTVRDIWSKNARHVRTALKRFRTSTGKR